AQDQLRARPSRRGGGGEPGRGAQGRQDLSHRRRVRGGQPQAHRGALGQRGPERQGVRTRARAMRGRDPALRVTVLLLWGLLALFVLYPLLSLLGRVATDGGRLSLGSAFAILADPHQLRAFGNSLLLATLVGLAGTALGFLFALTASRAGLGRGWLGVLDAVTL